MTTFTGESGGSCRRFVRPLSFSKGSTELRQLVMARGCRQFFDAHRGATPSAASFPQSSAVADCDAVRSRTCPCINLCQELYLRVSCNFLQRQQRVIETAPALPHARAAESLAAVTAMCALPIRECGLTVHVNWCLCTRPVPQDWLTKQRRLDGAIWRPGSPRRCAHNRTEHTCTR